MTTSAMGKIKIFKEFGTAVAIKIVAIPICGDF
jgi:hypothetical protein